MVLKVSPDELANLSGQLRSTSSRISYELERLHFLINQLDSSWEGADASAFFQKVMNETQNSRRLIEVINELYDYLQEVAEAYQQAESTVANTIITDNLII